MREGERMVRQMLIDAYLDYRNNYITIHKYAEHNGLRYEEAVAFIDACRLVFYSEHPER